LEKSRIRIDLVAGDNRFVIRTDVKSCYASIGHVLPMERPARFVPDRA